MAGNFLESDSRDLRWFFGRGQSCFERSTFGPMIERAKLYGWDSAGHRVLSPPAVEAQVWRYRQASCRRTPAKLSPELVSELRELLDLDTHDPAPTVLHGRAHGGEGPAYEHDDREIRRYAVVSRTLGRISAAQQQSLGLFYGLRAVRWAQHRLGRMLVLYSLTEPGKRLIRGEGRPDDLIAQAWADQQAWPKPERARLLEQARRASLKLLNDARRAYAAAR